MYLSADRRDEISEGENLPLLDRQPPPALVATPLKLARRKGRAAPRRAARTAKINRPRRTDVVIIPLNDTRLYVRERVAVDTRWNAASTVVIISFSVRSMDGCRWVCGTGYHRNDNDVTPLYSDLSRRTFTKLLDKERRILNYGDCFAYH